MNTQMEQWIAVGTSVTANCIPCVQYHAAKAKEGGMTEDEIAQAIRIAKRVRKGARGKMDERLASISGENTSASLREANACESASDGPLS